MSLHSWAGQSIQMELQPGAGNTISAMYWEPAQLNTWLGYRLLHRSIGIFGLRACWVPSTSAILQAHSQTLMSKESMLVSVYIKPRLIHTSLEGNSSASSICTICPIFGLFCAFESTHRKATRRTFFNALEEGFSGNFGSNAASGFLSVTFFLSQSTKFTWSKKKRRQTKDQVFKLIVSPAKWSRLIIDYEPLLGAGYNQLGSSLK